MVLYTVPTVYIANAFYHLSNFCRELCTTTTKFKYGSLAICDYTSVTLKVTGESSKNYRALWSTYPTSMLLLLHWPELCLEYASKLTIFTDSLLWTCAYEQRAHGGQSIGVAIKKQYLLHSWALLIDWKHREANFSLSSTDSSSLRVAQMPRCGDLAILVSITDDRQNQLLYPLRMCAG